jgi:hypothetical protein
VCLLKPVKITYNSKGTSLLYHGINYGPKMFYDTGHSLLLYGINYDRKKFYNAGPWYDKFIVKSVRVASIVF